MILIEDNSYSPQPILFHLTSKTGLTTPEVIFWDADESPVVAAAEVAVGYDPVSVRDVTTTPEVSLVFTITPIVVAEKRK
jgi:hypothetical protein